MAAATTDAGSTVLSPSRPRGGRITRTLLAALKTRRGTFGAAVSLFVIAIAFLGPLLASKSAIASAGLPFSSPGHGAGLFGTDVLGRDVFSRVLNGGHRLLLLSLAATVLAVGGGAAAGVVAAYRGGFADALIMRSVDVLLAIPQLVFALLLLSVVGPKVWLVILAVGITQAPQVARVIHAAAQDVSERDYVKAVAAWGVPPRTVIRRHVMPSLITPIMVESGLRLSFSIVLIAGLSFLGLGPKPPAPDWGVMISENQLGLGANVWCVLAPAILLALLAIGVNTFSDAIARVSVEGDPSGDPLMGILAAEREDTDVEQELHPGPASATTEWSTK
jgi:peptide/nickel transport system permease protein